MFPQYCHQTKARPNRVPPKSHSKLAELNQANTQKDSKPQLLLSAHEFDKEKPRWSHPKSTIPAP